MKRLPAPPCNSITAVSMSELTRGALSGNFLACCLLPPAVVVASASSSWVSEHKVHEGESQPASIPTTIPVRSPASNILS